MPQVLRRGNTIVSGAIQNNVLEVIADRAPGDQDDASDGYITGTEWGRVDAAGVVQRRYMCVDNTPSSAAWQECYRERRMFLFNSEPDVTDDSSSGYLIGDRAFVAEQYEYICVNNALGAAQWSGISSVGGGGGGGNSTHIELAADPGVNDDSSQGFAVGDLWLHQAVGLLWIAIDVSVGAAEWVLVTAEYPVSNRVFQENGAPDANDGENDGIDVGDFWFDRDTGRLYICQDNTNGSSVWNEVTADPPDLSSYNKTTVVTDPPDATFCTPTYNEGDKVIDSDTGRIYVCLDNANAAAVWREVGRTLTRGSVAPTTTDDRNLGYVPGDLWYDFNNNVFYQCSDNTATAAVWDTIPMGPYTERTEADPTINDDSSMGYKVNDQWLNAATGALFILNDPTVGAAQWIQVTAPSGASVPTGTMMLYAGVLPSAPPSGWLYCNGSEYAQSDYADLYAVIGSLYDSHPSFGSAQIGSFRVPDLRSRYPLPLAATGSDYDPAAYQFAGSDQAVAPLGTPTISLGLNDGGSNAVTYNTTGVENSNAVQPVLTDASFNAGQCYVSGSVALGNTDPFNVMNPYVIVPGYIIKT